MMDYSFCYPDYNCKWSYTSSMRAPQNHLAKKMPSSYLEAAEIVT